MHNYLEFEKSIAGLEGKVQELRHLTGSEGVNIAEEVGRLQAKVEKLLKSTYAKLSPWEKVMVARHTNRPHTVDYLRELVTEFTPLAGDRAYAEDSAIIGGLGRFRGQSIVVIGHEKGSDTDTRIKHSFGMARPEGYRKAQRLMKLADQFHLPVITFVDTPGAYPGIDAEARGQAEAIARSIEVCLSLKVPMVSVIIGEGGSGGAIAVATANTVLMLEHSIYSVISPEGCASILWRDKEQNQVAAEALRLTAQDLLKLGVIDAVIAEPLGGAHREPLTAISAVADEIDKSLAEFAGLDGGIIKAKRREKFLKMGKQGLS